MTLKVDIGIITYHRHEGLLRLVKSLDELSIDDSFKINSVIIVDNSPDNTIQELESELNTSKHDVTIAHEERAGIPYARNKVVELSTDSDFLAFIDDDEYPEEDWIVNLIETQKKYNSEVVQGPVISEFEEMTEKWIKYRHMRKRRETGTQLFSMATNNVLIQTSILKKMEEPFNTQLAQTGGTDSLLGRQLIKRGYEIIWCDEAIVYEIVPPKRANVKWILQRSFRGGNNYSVQLKELGKGYYALFERFFKCVLHILTGILTLPLSVLPIKERLFPLSKMSEGIGGLVGLFNFRYEEYKR